ncbi:MAG: alpha/beta hydrolase [Deltaproteobacteria bacterium]|nr:alpha/beta hydrolase [Deltaproteobacteria bacterium]
MSAKQSDLEINGITVPCLRGGEGRQLLVLHAEFAAGVWGRFHDLLAERFEVIMPEHPGFGRFERPDWLDGMPDLVYHYLELLDRLGSGQFNLLGESFGGWIAAELAALVPERLRSLVLIAPMGVSGPRAQTPDIFVMNEAQRRQLTLLRPDGKSSGAETSRQELERQARVKATLARVGWNPYLHDPRLPHWLHRARLPCLLLWGQADRFIAPETAELWLQRMPNARLRTVEHAGHFPQLEQPEETAKAVMEFLA